MDGKFDVKKTALTLGIVFAAWHLGWVLAVLVFGQGFMNWILALHFMLLPMPLAAFDIVTLIVGVVAAFLCGAVTGAIFAYVWNWLK